MSFKNGFHGRTLGALSATHCRPIHKLDVPAFDWPVARFPQLKYPLDEHKRENEAEEVNIYNICIKPFANYLISTQIKSFIVLPILHQIKPIQVGWFISASLRPVHAAHFKEILQRWRAVGNTVSSVTGLRFKSQISYSRVFFILLSEWRFFDGSVK